MDDLEAKVRHLEAQLQEKDAALNQVCCELTLTKQQLEGKDAESNKLRCELIQTKQQLHATEQQIATHEDYKLKLEQVLSNMQVQHELIVAKLTQADQLVDTGLLSQNKMRLELQETFEDGTRTEDTRVHNLVIDKEKFLHHDMPKSVPQLKTLQCPTQCQGDSENQIQPVLVINGTDFYHGHSDHTSSSAEVSVCEQATQDVESFYHTAYYGSASVYNMPGNESLQLLEDDQHDRASNNSHTT